MSKINIKDESGDRKYFTIIPNYVLNHSTMWDREVYVQMKRITGEDGTCWTSRRTLAKQCGMSVRRLDKSILYLAEHKWIENIGKKEVATKGGAQEVNEYRIADLWKLNVDYYENLKGGALGATPKGGAQTEPKVVHEDVKGGAHGAHKEEPVLIRTIIKEEPTFLSEFENVLLKDNELDKLKVKFGEKNAFILIEELGGYLASTGKKYNSHYATLLNWGRRKIQNHQEKAQLQIKKRTIATI
jgi:hypothetical protein